MDQTNLKLMQELQEDGRRSNRVLAKALGVSEGTVRKRIRDLRGKDLVRIVAVPNLHNMGFEFICIMGLQVRLSEIQQVSEQLAQYPNVYYLSNVTGRYDLMAILLFHNAREMDDFVREAISAMPAIHGTETFVSMNIVKSPWRQALNVAELLRTGRTKERK